MPKLPRKLVLTINKTIADHNNHLNFLEAQQLLRKEAWGLLEDQGFSRETILERYHLRLFVRHINIDYTLELGLGDTVTILTTAVVGKTSITFKQVAHNKQGKTAITSATTVVAVNNKRPTPIPTEIKKQLTKV
ncbi:MAG TPA: acyl-CoA thioesterase [Candidatus Nanoarchaeia archaeon]|nr:acyl-CoA thioesterase [Candidatus Nanoarchaeia archaeon]